MGCMQGIYQSVEYMNSHIDDILTIDYCCEIAGISKSHYIKMFRFYIGYTPQEYISKARLKISAEQIHSNKKLIDIALEAGYESHEAFTRAFHMEFGMLPSEYRKMARIITSPIEELSDIERVIAFFPAPSHRADIGISLYGDHFDTYQKLMDKGYFNKSDLGYCKEGKEITEKYAYDCENIILSVAGSSDTLEEIYHNTLKIRYIPKLLFHHFLFEMMDNGLLEDTCLRKCKKCFKCDTYKATLWDEDEFRQNETERMKSANIFITKKDVNCYGITSGELAEYCNVKSDDFNTDICC